jgi:hypothetical protein
MPKTSRKKREKTTHEKKRWDARGEKEKNKHQRKRSTSNNVYTPTSSVSNHDDCCNGDFQDFHPGLLDYQITL